MCIREVVFVVALTLFQNRASRNWDSFERRLINLTDIRGSNRYNLDPSETASD
jgi:hypothetical protein